MAGPGCEQGQPHRQSPEQKEDTQSVTPTPSPPTHGRRAAPKHLQPPCLHVSAPGWGRVRGSHLSPACGPRDMPLPRLPQLRLLLESLPETERDNGTEPGVWWRLCAGGWGGVGPRTREPSSQLPNPPAPAPLSPLTSLRKQTPRESYFKCPASDHRALNPKCGGPAQLLWSQTQEASLALDSESTLSTWPSVSQPPRQDMGICSLCPAL